MKKIFVSVFALLMISALGGCGDMRVSDPLPTAVPYVTANPNDGMVNDRDGIITDNDTGTGTSAGNNTVTGSRRTGTVDIQRNDKDYDR